MESLQYISGVVASLMAFLLLTSLPPSTNVLTTAMLVVEPLQVVTEVGTDAIFICTDSDGVIDPNDISWNYTSTATNTSARFHVANGTLTLRALQLTDSGHYQCMGIRSPKGKNETFITTTRNSETNSNNDEGFVAMPPPVKLLVYEMPDYVVYIEVVSAMIGALVFVVIVGQIHRVRMEQVKRKQRKATVSASRKKNNSPEKRMESRPSPSMQQETHKV